MRRRLALAASATLVLSGCTGGSVDDDRRAGTGPGAEGPLVAEDVVRLDLREAPTAEEAGLVGDRRDLILSRVGEAIDVELQLPRGTLAVDAFQVNIGGPLGEPDPSYAGQVLVNVRGGDTAAVLARLSEQAAVLGLDSAVLEDWGSQFPSPDRLGNRYFRSAVSGPGIEVGVRSDNDESWTLNYSFSFDQPSADAVGTPS